MDPETQDYAEMINAASNGWVAANGLKVVRATPTEVVGEMPIRPDHLQAYGLVHGGIHAAIIETLASIGAAITAFSRGESVVGLENHTSFVRAVRSGTLHAVAKPITRGRKTHVWEGSVHDDEGRLAA